MSEDGRIAIDDVDDVIEAAAKAHAVERETLSVEEVLDVARQLQLPGELVVPAIARVRKQRRERLAADAERATQAAKRLQVIAGIAATVVLALVAWGASARAHVRDAWSRVEKHRVEVVDVRDRQRATKARWAEVADSPRKHAELSGAENRVRVEHHSYDAAAVAYNDVASGLMAELVVEWSDYPESVPLSSQVQW